MIDKSYWNTSRKERLKRYGFITPTPAHMVKFFICDEKGARTPYQINAGIFTDFCLFELIRTIDGLVYGEEEEELKLIQCGLRYSSCAETVGYPVHTFDVWIKGANEQKAILFKDFVLDIIEKEPLIPEEFKLLRQHVTDTEGKTFVSQHYLTKMGQTSYCRMEMDFPKETTDELKLLNFASELTGYLKDKMVSYGFTYAKGYWSLTPYIDPDKGTVGVMYFVDAYVKPNIISLIASFFEQLIHREFSSGKKTYLN